MDGLPVKFYDTMVEHEDVLLMQNSSKKRETKEQYQKRLDRMRSFMRELADLGNGVTMNADKEFITKYDKKWVSKEDYDKLVDLLREGIKLTCVHRSEKQADYTMEHHDEKDPCDLCTWAWNADEAVNERIPEESEKDG